MFLPQKSSVSWFEEKPQETLFFVPKILSEICFLHRQLESVVFVLGSR